jgi:RNA polymerase-binding transcription factor DksA
MLLQVLIQRWWGRSISLIPHSEEGAMRINRVEARTAVLRLMFARLSERYGVEIHSDDQLDRVSLHEVDSLLAFKSDQRLEDLRKALSRLDDGTYGRCLCCKGVIEPQLLGLDPARRVCSRCEQRFFHPVGIPAAEKKYFVP